MLEKLNTVIETISIEEITHYFICDNQIKVKLSSLSPVKYQKQAAQSHD